MTPLFTIRKTEPRPSYRDISGAAWGCESDARYANAEIAGKRAMPRGYFDYGSRLTLLHNLAKAPVEDLRTLRDVFAHHVDVVLPQFDALKGRKFRSGGDVIELADGSQFYDRHNAANHLLEQAFRTLFKERGERLSEEGVHAVCNISPYTSRTSIAYRQGVTEYSFSSALTGLLKRSYHIDGTPDGREQDGPARVRKMLQAMVEARALSIQSHPAP